MTGKEAIAYIHSFQWEKHEPGLHRIRELLSALGNPQKELKFVHVAGTNGKGSTCAMLAAVLQAAGYRVGLNTSPYIMTFHERICVNGQMISDEQLAALVERVQPAAEKMEEHPSEFELITAIAMLYFKEQQCDIVVLEVGLGGALDASNVIDCPEVAVLAAMGMDHTAILGPTIADIAEAKAGIIKENGTVVSYGACAEADAVFRRKCGAMQAELREVQFQRLQNARQTLEGSDFWVEPYGELRLSLAGSYQLKNAMTAITALETLTDKGWKIPQEAFRKGLAVVKWPGRLEVLQHDPVFLLDGAHNAHGMRAAVESLNALTQRRKITFVLGVLADKDVAEMLDMLAGLAERTFVIRPESPRALPAESLCQMLHERKVPAVVCESIPQAVEAAAEVAGKDGVVCALGSLYSSGDVKRAVENLSLKKKSC